MPRIRTIKPEALQHRKVGRLSDREFRLWVAMLTQADDEGRLVADAGQLKLIAWGYHPRVTVKHVQDALQTISDLGLVRLYDVNGTGYACFPSWRDHQRIDKPSPSRLPAPINSTNAPRTFSEGFETVPVGSDRKDRIKEQGSEGTPRGGSPREGDEQPPSARLWGASAADALRREDAEGRTEPSYLERIGVHSLRPTVKLCPR